MPVYLLRVIGISVLCMLFTAISNADIGIISQIASQSGNHWIGPLSISCIFLGSGCGALWHGYLGRWSYRRIIVTGAMGWNGFLTFSVLFLFLGFKQWLLVVIIAGSLVCGLTVSMYYNGINNYVGDCGRKDNRIEIYYGINTCIIQCANIVGNGLSALLIEPLGQKVYSCVMLALVIIFSLSFLVLPQVNQTRNAESLIEDAQQQQDNGGQALIDTQSQEVAVLSGNPPYLFYFVFGLSGIVISFVYTLLSIAYYYYYPEQKEQVLNRITFLTFMIQGFGQLVGGLLLAFISRYISSLLIPYIINGIMFVLSAGLILLAFMHHSQWLLNISAFAIGVTDCMAFGAALAIASRWGGRGISLFNFGQSSTVAIFSLLYIWVSFPVALILYSVYLIAVIVILIVYRTTLQTNPGQQQVDSA